MFEITEILAKKRDLLKLAEAEVKTLLAQISALEDAFAGDTDFAKYLEEKKAKLTPALTPTVAPSTSALRDHFEKPKKADATASGRNPKGLIRRVILDSLTDGVERDLDYIEFTINQKIPSPIARSALRGFLMNLRNEEILMSRKKGLFQLAQKGETRL